MIPIQTLSGTVIQGGGNSLVFNAPLTNSLIPNKGGSPTFTRATTATVTDHEGILRYAKSGEARFQGARRVENLVPKSEDVTSWDLGSAITATTTTEAGLPPGTTNTIKLSINAAGLNPQYFRRNSGATTGRSYAIRCYAKAGSYNYVGLRVGTVGSQHLTFNLSNGQVVAGTTGNVTRWGIKDAGNGWWLVFGQLDVATGAVLGIGVVSSTGAESWTAAGSETIYVTGIQFEEVTGQSNPVSAEYVSVGVLSAPFHGANVDGVKYFGTLNGNTVNGSGVVTEATGPSLSAITNILPRSEEFNDSLWVKGGSSVTADSIVAPTGASTADTLTEDISGSVHRVTRTLTVTSGSPLCFSAYAKTNGRDVELALLKFGTGDYVSYRVALASLTPTASHSLGSTWSSPSISVQDVGNGWCRIMMCANATGMTSVQAIIGLVNGGTNSYTGDGTSGAYIWGAQVTETSSTVPYIATTSAAASRDFLLGYLSESQRTNLLTNSEDITAWGLGSAGTRTANAIAAPDGRTTADKLSEAAVTDAFYILSNNVSATSGLSYTASAYLKIGERRYAQLVFGSAAWGLNAYINADLQDGTITATGSAITASTITPIINGWYRITAIAPATATVAAPIAIAVLDSGSAGRLATYAGTAGSGLYIWGAQLEQIGNPVLARSSTYIATTSATVTRNKDVLEYPIPTSVDSVGSAYAEITRLFGFESANSRVIGSVGANSPAAIFINGSTGFGIYDGSTAVNPISGGSNPAISVGETVRGAASWTTVGPRRAVSYRGLVSSAATFDGGQFPTLAVCVGNGSGTTEGLSNPIRNAKLWKKALPDAILQAMTQ